MHRFLAFAFFTASGFSIVSAQSPAFSERDPRYRLQASDSLEVHYRFSPQLDQTVTVQPDGFVSLNIVGDIKLQGLTLDQVKITLLQKAGERLQDPEITLVLKDFERPYFVVGGEVNRPGRFEMHGTVTALQAIAIAGGFNNITSKHSQVVLFRKISPDFAKTQIINLKQAMRGSVSEPDIDLRAGDMLIVPQNRLSRIERIVKIASISAYVPF